MAPKHMLDEPVRIGRRMGKADPGEHAGGTEQDHARAEIVGLARQFRLAKRRPLVDLEAARFYRVDDGREKAEVTLPVRALAEPCACGEQALGEESVGIGEDACRRCLRANGAGRVGKTGVSAAPPRIVGEIAVTIARPADRRALRKEARRRRRALRRAAHPPARRSRAWVASASSPRPWIQP